jgi:protoheme ferro-lyase
MLFSERYGYKKVKMLKKDEMPDHLKTRIWNVFDSNIFSRFNIRDPLSSYTEATAKFILNLWDKFLKRDTDEIKGVGSRYISLMVKQVFYDLKGSEIYEFINFFLKAYQGRITEDKVLVQLNEVLEEECAPYRIGDGKVIPLISEEEIKEIETALNIPDKYKPVREHLSNL